MPDRHKDAPIPYRPPVNTDIRDWLARHAASAGVKVNRVITDAINAYRASLEASDKDKA
jgi:hypothetical protein